MGVFEDDHGHATQFMRNVRRGNPEHDCDEFPSRREYRGQRHDDAAIWAVRCEGCWEFTHIEIEEDSPHNCDDHREGRAYRGLRDDGVSIWEIRCNACGQVKRLDVDIGSNPN